MATKDRLISADALIRDINADLYRTESEKAYDRCLVHRQPTVNAVEVVHGRWIWDEKNGCWVCSECELSALNDYRGNSTDSDYCPHCGAKMDGGAENVL